MIKVKDTNGNIIRGVYRSSNGTLVVKDDALMEKHSAQIASKLSDKHKIESLERSVEELTLLVKSLLGNRNDH